MLALERQRSGQRDALKAGSEQTPFVPSHRPWHSRPSGRHEAPAFSLFPPCLYLLIGVFLDGGRTATAPTHKRPALSFSTPGRFGAAYLFFFPFFSFSQDIKGGDGGPNCMKSWRSCDWSNYISLLRRRIAFPSQATEHGFVGSDDPK